MSTALIPCPESSSHGTAGPTCHGCRILDPGKQRYGGDPSGGEPYRIYRAHRDSRVRFFRRVHPMPRTPKGGARALGLWRL